MYGAEALPLICDQSWFSSRMTKTWPMRLSRKTGTASPAVAKRTALQQYLQTFFGGSLRQMMTTLVAEASWTDDDLDAIKDEIDRVRKERKK